MNPLEQIYNLVSDYIASGRDVPVSTARLLNEILELSQPRLVEDMPEQKTETKEPAPETLPLPWIEISCDASIKENPGGPASIGYVIRRPVEDGVPALKMAQVVSANTNNEAEYDAIYQGLLTFVGLVNRPKYPIKIMSDSQLVVNQLLGTYTINNDILKRKAAAIHALATSIPVPVVIEWRARNSTPDLTEANFLAQDILGVRRH